MTRDEELRAAWAGVSAAFAALGQVFLCLDERFRVIHASESLDALLGEGATTRAEGRTVEELLGEDVLGVDSALRQALLAGERREGWRASLELEDGAPHLVSVTAAPMSSPQRDVCDPRAHFVVVLRPSDEDLQAHSAPTRFSGMVARSARMLAIFRLIENLRDADATVLITGESGTGKELVARAIHEHSTRKGGPFVAVNCGALPGELLESEMFGHVRGAFTSAVRDRVGRFEAASTGTLFLDEVGELPPPLQVKLLRALQERTFERVGENRTRRSEARVIAATNADLEREAFAGSLREDLFYRLRVVPISIPPLRSRPEDIEPLARALLARVAARHGKILRLSPDAVRALLGYSWPGNVRELENALEFAAAVSKRETLLPDDLPQNLADHPRARRSPARPAAPPEPPERQALRRALDEHHWRRADAAKALGISRTTLWRRMREAGLVD